MSIESSRNSANAAMPESSRRTFMRRSALIAASALAWTYAKGGSAKSVLEPAEATAVRTAACASVLSLHMDQIYFDPTGTAQPFAPRPRPRPAAERCLFATEAELRMHHPYF